MMYQSLSWAKNKFKCALLWCISSLSFFATAQDLEPRAYLRVPINANVILPALSFSQGNVLLDPTVPLKDFKANLTSTAFGYARTFSLFGLTAQAFVVQPFCVAQASALLNGQDTVVDRVGLADMRARLSVLLLGGEALELADFLKNKEPRTILGASLTLQLPTGQYDKDKLVNLGNNRWAFKPEIAWSQPLGQRWLLDFYAAVWLFTKNDNYFPGDKTRSQQPIGAIQSHISYNIGPFAWAAINSTFYTGGHSVVDGFVNNDEMSNVRLGATLVLPTGKRSGLKFAFSKGALVTRGANFSTFSVGWNYSWFAKK